MVDMTGKIRKPRILFIGTLPPPVHGSAVVSQQVKESKVINEAFDGDWINLGTSRTMDEIGEKTIAKPFRLLEALCKEFWYLLTKHYDLCYLAITCHGIGFLKDSPFVLMANLFRRRIIIHQHNKGMARDIGRWPYRWLLPLCYKNAKVILLSWRLYPDIENVVKKEDVFICPNGIKVQEYHNSVFQGFSETWNMKPKINRVPRMLFLSNLIESKGVLVLLDALIILKNKGCLCVCDFVGGETKEFDAKRFYVEVEKRGLNELALYHGRKYGEDKEMSFRQADIFVLPTYYDDECFPLVLLEAMSFGLPCVSTNEGAISEIIDEGKTGFVVEKQNSQHLADRLEILIIDANLRKEMGYAGKAKFEEQFTLDKFERNLFNIFLFVERNM